MNLSDFHFIHGCSLCFFLFKTKCMVPPNCITKLQTINYYKQTQSDQNLQNEHYNDSICIILSNYITMMQNGAIISKSLFSLDFYFTFLFGLLFPFFSIFFSFFFNSFQCFFNSFFLLDRVHILNFFKIFVVQQKDCKPLLFLICDSNNKNTDFGHLVFCQ